MLICIFAYTDICFYSCYVFLVVIGHDVALNGTDAPVPPLPVSTNVATAKTVTAFDPPQVDVITDPVSPNAVVVAVVNAVHGRRRCV